MNTEYLISLVTVVVTLIFGKISKKSKFINNNLIPIQNLLIGLIIALIEFGITKDYNVAIAASGLFAGGLYDIVHNLQKIKDGDE